MCGIAGVYAYGQANPNITAERLEKMAFSMAHRGPDSSGVYEDSAAGVGLAFRRLSIVDLTSAGDQPMPNEDESIWMVFNGEIYNAPELRNELMAKGHRFRSRTDSEVVLHLYEEMGTRCVDRLNGMFAFAIWDSRIEELVLARDRLGIKPLYWTRERGCIVFGSEIRALLEWGISPEPDFEALQYYLTFMVPPAPLTMLRGIRKLLPGTVTTINRTGQLDTRSYWNPLDSSRTRIDDASVQGEILEALRDSVQLRMMSDVPVGVFLSGGIDSSTNVALMSEIYEQKLNTFTIGFEEQRYNEFESARTVATHYGTEHHELVLTPSQAREGLSQIIHSQDEPIGDWVCIPLHFLASFARDNGVYVVHVGEGADELFGGYPKYMRVLQRLRRRGWLDRAAGSIARTAATSALPMPESWHRAFQDVSTWDPAFWGLALVFRGRHLHNLTDTPFWKNHPRVEPSRLPARHFREYAERAASPDPLNAISYLEVRNRLAELLLMRVDKMTMASSVEARVPFLDHRIVELAFQLDSRQKVPNLAPKESLKRAVAPLLPHCINERSKQGFSAPISEWFRGAMAKDLQETLLRGDLLSNGILNRRYVESLVGRHLSGQADNALELWNLFNLETWWKRCISANSHAAARAI